MKIGLFTDSYLPTHDGVATSVALCAKELKLLGHEVYVIAPNQPHVRIRKNVFRLASVRLFKEPEVWIGLDLPEPVLLKLSTIDFDIIHGHSGGPISLLGWQLAQIRGIPFVETYHTLWRHYLHYFPFPHMISLWTLKKISTAFSNDCDAMIAPSEKAKRELITYKVKKPIYVIPSGVLLDLFNVKKDDYLHAKLQINPRKKILLTVGRLEKEKSIDFLLEAFSKVYKKHPETVFVLIGEGRYTKKLTRTIKKLGIDDAVYFAGVFSYEHMPKIYASADLFLFASRTESQGMVLVEALASGVPVLTVEDDAYSDVVVNGVNGFMVERDSEIFAQKVIHLLENPTLLSHLSKNACGSVEKFSVYNSAKKLEEVYMELIEKKNSIKGWFWHKLLSFFS